MSDYDQLAYNLRKPLSAFFLSLTSGYVSGTWTPALTGTTIAGTFTYTAQAGTYTRIGDRVLLTARISISAIAVAPTGNLTITGLPITANATGVVSTSGNADFTDFTGITFGAGYTRLGGRITPSTTVISLTESGSNIQAIFLPAGALVLVGGAAEFIITGQYQA